MIGIAVQIQGAGEQLRRLEQIAISVKSPRALLAEVGRRAVNELRGHYRDMERQQPNALGGKRTHFWRRVADSVSGPTMRSATEAVVSITHPGIAQKVFGGTITPKKASVLTIPVHPAAHGRRASVLAREAGIKLFVIGKKDGRDSNGLLAGRLPSGDIEIFYVLRKSVNQKREPGALPSRAKFEAALVDQAEKHLARATA